MKMHQVIKGFQPQRGISMRSQVKKYLRKVILEGQLPPGSKLPPTLELAAAWGTHAPAVQAAMASLVKEGLIKRLMGRGTFVSEQVEGLRKVALYISRGRRHTHNFAGYLMQALEAQLAQRGIRSEPWINRQPDSLAEQPWDNLEQAAKRREIQGVIVVAVDVREAAWLAKLPVPVVFLASEPLANRVAMSMDDALDDAMASVASQGCRSIGMINVVARAAKSDAGEHYAAAAFYENFNAAAGRHGLAVRSEWIQSPPVDVSEQAAAKFGYESFHKLWNQAKKPEAIFVHTDVAAQGVLIALGQRRVRVPEDLHLVLHRNAELGLFCPVPASFIDVSVQKLAAALVDLLQRIYRGESVPQPLSAPLGFVPEDATPSVVSGEFAAVAG